MHAAIDSPKQLKHPTALSASTSTSSYVTSPSTYPLVKFATPERRWEWKHAPMSLRARFAIDAFFPLFHARPGSDLWSLTRYEQGIRVILHFEFWVRIDARTFQIFN